ncbi:hypothetical protein [Mesorhizobium sp. M4B.F.Ca.ET.017.02.2.1]|uniref:hypothetical protein n=1 Tax=Mesorhizobium sp. M4B.F.Ca.ET.017.02.2.1 TaxID=2496649 RepID=UPI000FCAE4B3|nr:hypothetical protein [Mesorhizobium sp. M4B.F.Ca.ET.017.02.2.1]RVD30529.1 hypothetical protein EN738_05720 [Mesorhizobium sp. M4B.F.Ca.ET.017.02.2.1]
MADDPLFQPDPSNVTSSGGIGPPLGLSRVKPGANAFTGFPAQYEGATSNEWMQDALDTPLSLFSTLVESARGEVLESYGLGTAIRDITIPQGNEPPSIAEPAYGMTLIPIPGAYSLAKTAVQSFMDQGKPLSEDQYKASASFREGIPWDQGMTDTRAAALADAYDAKQVRDYFTAKRPFAAFIGGLAGQALDPINYVPVFGESVKAAQVARFGYVGGRLLTNAAEAAINTGAASVLTAGERAKFGADVSWQSTVSQIAMAALIGGAFGAVHGAFEGRVPRIDPTLRLEAEDRLSTLKNVQESRIALNEGIDAVVRGEDLNLSPNATEPLSKITQDVQRIEATARATADATPITNPATMEDVASSYRAVAAAHPEMDPTVSPSQFDSLMIADLQAKGFDAIAGAEKARPMPLSFNPATLDMPAVMKKPIFGEIAPDASPGSPEFAAGVSRLAAKDAQAKVADLTRRYEVGNRMHNRLIRWLDPKTGIGFGRFENHEMLPQLIAYHQRELAAASRPIDTQRPAPEALPAGHQEAQARVAKPEDLATQYHVDAKTGAFKEEADLRQLADEGRLSEEDLHTMEEAHTQFDQATAYGEALKSFATCLI